ncbi:MAG: peptidylprolyl isomerase [Candidatus Eremiobacteraeota bacterium]|nr:peptidylprolyl isomerase [Candidatus Eremiobacteraeota bacterium]
MFAGCANGGGSNVATVNGQGISRSEFETKLETLPQAKQIFTQMVQGVLIDQYARDNKVTVSDADVKKKEEEIKAKYPAGQFEQILKSQNLTEADVQKILRQQLILGKAIGPNIKISDADVKAYLAKSHATLDTPEQVRARHILVPDLKTAQEVEAKLKGGAKFEDTAQKYSTDPQSKVKGGELGFFSRGQMVPSFQAAAFSQPAGVVGPPVKSPFGYHIIQVEERKKAQVATLANSGEKIRATLTSQQEGQQIPAFLQKLRNDAKITINDAALQDAFPPVVPTAAPAGSPATASPPSPAAKK